MSTSSSDTWRHVATATPAEHRPAEFARLREELDALSRRLVADLHTPNAALFWTDMLGSAALGWATLVWAVASAPFSWQQMTAIVISALAFYRGLCFTHEITHLRRRAVPGFETVWNLVLGVPLLLPSFTYVGVHQSHHSLSTYGTRDDPEYLPFRKSRRLIVQFAIQSSFLVPPALVMRFLILSPIGLLVPAFHRLLEARASSFAMNPLYRRAVTPAQASEMRRWEIVILALWAIPVILAVRGSLPWRAFVVWAVVVGIASFVNTARVLGAHDYETDGHPRDRHGQLADSIDTPGAFWTEIWAPVGLRYHALHHYFPGIPYHNLGRAYRRLIGAVAPGSPYLDSTSPSLWQSLRTLYQKAKRQYFRLTDW
ncbi:MAG TPA: fatty acid desaturase [Vicinamibacterales bacterium]|nr:fatty acid desaturase [Vicinamibacterales bacterium]